MAEAVGMLEVSVWRPPLQQRMQDARYRNVWLENLIKATG